ncbi:hypothetical protein U9M48_039162 [Paspalum notatum var. saurae]|uniref:Protein MIS12 homolog n=1 Tax=Paspalum notatum var. saurae TaxID=547442 RepID=A0AAQ3UKU1_PASNO
MSVAAAQWWGLAGVGEGEERDQQANGGRAAAAPGVLGDATAALKATELQRGLNAIRHVIKDALDKRMTNWEKYCFQHCFYLPEGFVVPEDTCEFDVGEDSVSTLSGECQNYLDLEVDSFRKKLESANKESEDLQRELSALKRQATYKRKLDSAVAEIQKLFEDKFVQQNFEGMTYDLLFSSFTKTGRQRRLHHLSNSY